MKKAGAELLQRTVLWYGKSLRAAGIAALLLILPGCQSLRQGLRIDLPFIESPEPNQCGVVCLAMALRHFQMTYDITDLSKEAFIPFLSGSTPELLADTAERYGLKADISDFTLTEIVTLLEEDCLIIAFLPPVSPAPIGHFVLVTGIKPASKRIRAHDGIRRNRWICISDETLLCITLKAPTNCENR